MTKSTVIMKNSTIDGGELWIYENNRYMYSGCNLSNLTIHVCIGCSAFMQNCLLDNCVIDSKVEHKKLSEIIGASNRFINSEFKTTENFNDNI